MKSMSQSTNEHVVPGPWPTVIIKKKLWDRCESQEEVAGYTALEYSYICFSLSIFRGNKVISPSALDVKTQYILSGMNSFVWCWVALCGVLKDGVFMAPQDHKHSLSPGQLWICVWLTQGQREGNHLQLVFWHRGVLFFLCQLSASSTENKQNTLALVNIVMGSPVWLFFPFLPSHGDRGWHFWKISYCHADTRRTTSCSIFP